jgi:hypothetical protein
MAWRKMRETAAGPWSLLASIDPQPPHLGSSTARIEHWDRRVVGEQMVRGEHVFAPSFVQRFQPPARAANPSDQRRASEIGAMPGEDLCLPIKRRVITLFTNQHPCGQCRRSQSASDQPFRRLRLHDLVAGAESVFRTDDVSFGLQYGGQI